MKTDNELIAEFMGWKRSDGGDGVYHRGQWYNDKFQHLALGAELEYNTSWDWLMPVVEKISKISDEESMEFAGMMDSLELSLIRADITQSYRTAVSIIKWYNAHKKS